jgi:smad nuclear-interacting protein 1
VVLKYHEPPEARKPSSKDVWKLFVFKGKGEDVIDTVDLNGRSCWLVGRELSVADLPTQHPSVSKQHAVVQFRYVEKRDEYGERKGKVKPFVIDLESTHGTFLNGERIEERRYVEIRNKDVVRFGKSEREYVFMLDRD